MLFLSLDRSTRKKQRKTKLYRVVQKNTTGDNRFFCLLERGGAFIFEWRGAILTLYGIELKKKLENMRLCTKFI